MENILNFINAYNLKTLPFAQAAGLSPAAWAMKASGKRKWLSSEPQGIINYLFAVIAEASLVVEDEVQDGMEETIKLVERKNDYKYHTYFILCETTNLLKIGKSVDVKHRFISLQSSSPMNMVLLHQVNEDREAEFHERFQHLRKHGEWFYYTSDIKNFIEELKAKSE